MEASTILYVTSARRTEKRCANCQTELKGDDGFGSSDIFVVDGQPYCRNCRDEMHTAARSAPVEQAGTLEELAGIPVITGAPPVPYTIIDSVFALDCHKQGYLSQLFCKAVPGADAGGADPGVAFDGVKKLLRLRCQRMGGNAVVNCQFQYRIAIAGGLFGARQAVEIFAYGTAVKAAHPSPHEGT